tara:strand:- start:826 stop:1176 length:351 start_codon:yes stop_codon:yes gene_type:complete
MSDIFTQIGNSFINFFTKVGNAFASTGDEAIKFYFLLTIIVLCFCSLITAMIMKPPCNSSDNYQNKKNCTLLGETDDDTLLEWIQPNFLAFYIVNIFSACVCIIFSIILMYYTVKT